MLTFNYIGETLVGVSPVFNPKGINRTDFETLADAERVAAQATALRGSRFVACDQGPYNYPRFDVVEAPALGAQVSYGFNGDAYPCGTITKVSSSLRRVETSEGSVFYRRGQTASWVRGGTWNLIRGIHNERNPHI